MGAPMLNRIRFAARCAERPGARDEHRIEIDGIDLAELARAVERPFATAEGHPSIAGAYSGLDPADVLPPSRHFLGESQGIYRYDRRTQVLGCECGEPGCWPLVCLLEVSDAVKRPMAL